MINRISLPRNQPDDDPGDTGHEDIAGEHDEQQKSPLRFVPTSKRWRSFSPGTALGAIVAVPVHLVQRGRMLLVPRLEDFRTSTIGWERGRMLLFPRLRTLEPVLSAGA